VWRFCCHSKYGNDGLAKLIEFYGVIMLGGSPPLASRCHVVKKSGVPPILTAPGNISF
jgi:hypothetical protein